MGTFFSQAKWEETLDATVAPSLQATATYSPLLKDQQTFLKRPGRVKFMYPNSFKEGGIIMDADGRPVVGLDGNPLIDAGRPGVPDARIPKGGSVGPGGDCVQLSDAADASMLVAYDAEAGRVYAGFLLTASEGSPHKYSRAVHEVSIRVPSNVKIRKDASMMSTSSMTTTSTLGNTSSKKRMTDPLELEQFGETGDPAFPQERCFTHCLLYTVKEGILVYFSDDLESCEELVRGIAVRYRDESKLPPHGRRLEEKHSRDFPEIRSINYPVGRASPVVGRILADQVLPAELQREFKTSCSVEQQPQFTNCVVFCIRCIYALNLCVRGYDIQRICSETPAIGPVAGQVVGDMWEQLYRKVRA